MISLSLPEPLQTFVDAQASRGGFDTGDAYVLSLIQREQDRQHLRDLVLEGAQSGPGRVADSAYFDELRAMIAEKAA